MPKGIANLRFRYGVAPARNIFKYIGIGKIIKLRKCIWVKRWIFFFVFACGWQWPHGTRCCSPIRFAHGSCSKKLDNRTNFVQQEKYEVFFALCKPFWWLLLCLCIYFLYQVERRVLTITDLLSIFRVKLGVKKLYTPCAQLLNTRSLI